MKRLLAVLLTLCLAMAALPSLAEDYDYTGVWYGVVAGITGMTMTLNADGTAVAVYTDEPGEGTWTAEENGITVTIDGDPLALIRSGDVMTTPLFPYVFMRTPGQVTLAQLDAYRADGTLPEGIDKDTMDGIETNLEAVIEAYNAAQSAQQGETPAETSGQNGTATDTQGEPDVRDGLVLSTLKDNFLIRQQYSKNKALYYAVLQNNSEVKLFIANGSMTLLDAAGAEIAAAKFPYPAGSKYLEPGETTLMGFEVEVPEGVEVASHQVNIPAEQPTKWADPDIALEVTGVEMAMNGDGAFNENGAWVTVTNTQSEPISGIRMIVAFEDEEGTPWSLQTFNIYADKLGAGSSYSFWVEENKDLKEYCETNGITLTKAEAYAWKELDD